MPAAIARDDPVPLTLAQMRALGRATARELAWGLREVTRARRAWRARAERIPAGPLRDDALDALTRKRTHSDGAALLVTLAARRDPHLLRLLISYEMILDFLDGVSERCPDEANGRELHLAMVDAIEPERPLADYYRHHPWQEDAGYLRDLVEACRETCRALPSFDRVRRLAASEAWRTQVLALNHVPEPAARDAALQRWAASETDGEGGLAWFELSGAASSSLAILVLLALAADPELSEAELTAVHEAYWPWVSFAAVMLDSYSDRAEDVANGDHSYVGHYPCIQTAVERIKQGIDQAVRRTLALPRGEAHAVIVCSMIAMYLSKDSARMPSTLSTTRELTAAGGSLARLLLPVLRGWRIRYGHRAA